MILVLDTKSENTFVGLWDGKWLRQETFLGGRDLNSLLLGRLDKLFSNPIEFENRSVALGKLTGIIVSSGPGSFTGLRIGISVANTFAYSLDIPIVGISGDLEPEKLLQKGLAVLKSRGASFGEPVVPQYGAEPHITKPKKG